MHQVQNTTSLSKKKLFGRKRDEDKSVIAPPSYYMHYLWLMILKRFSSLFFQMLLRYKLVLYLIFFSWLLYFICIPYGLLYHSILILFSYFFFAYVPISWLNGYFFFFAFSVRFIQPKREMRTKNRDNKNSVKGKIRFLFSTSGWQAQKKLRERERETERKIHIKIYNDNKSFA